MYNADAEGQFWEDKIKLFFKERLKRNLQSRNVNFVSKALVCETIYDIIDGQGNE